MHLDLLVIGPPTYCVKIPKRLWEALAKLSIESENMAWTLWEPRHAALLHYCITVPSSIVFMISVHDSKEPLHFPLLHDLWPLSHATHTVQWSRKLWQLQSLSHRMHGVHGATLPSCLLTGTTEECQGGRGAMSRVSRVGCEFVSSNLRPVARGTSLAAQLVASEHTAQSPTSFWPWPYRWCPGRGYLYRHYMTL